MSTATPYKRLVSVILPTYERPETLARAVRSVLAQTHRELELIVVDDGSRQDVEPVLRACADNRIRFVRLAQNRGLASARNAGLDEAQGEYLAFQDDDDFWYPQKLERQLQFLATRPDVGLVYSDMHRVHRDGRRQYFRSPSIERGRLINPETGYWQTYMLAMQPVLLRRKLLGSLRFDESLVFFEDLDLHLRLSMQLEYLYLPEPLVDYVDTGGLTADYGRQLRGRWQLLRKYFGPLMRRERKFLVSEALQVQLRRSLMPIAQAHWSDLRE